MTLRLSDWIKEGLVAGVSGVLLSVLVAVFMSLLSLSGFPGVQPLEAASRDFTFRAAVALYGPIDWQGRQDSLAIDPLVFLDIDEAGCEALLANPSKCRVSGVVHQEIMLFLAKGLHDAGAKAIVLDTRLPDDRWFAREEERTAYFTHWDLVQTPVIAAMPGAAGQDNVFVFDDLTIPEDTTMMFAPAVLFDSDTTAGGIVRKLDASIATQRLSDGKIEAQATLAFALLNAIGTEYERKEEEPIFFTLPSTIIGDAFQGGGWERRALSLLLEQDKYGKLSLRTNDLKDQIILVGSSAPAARDMHRTSLGTMAGPEILANIIRDVQLFPKRAEVTWLDNLAWKIVSLLPAAVVLLVAETASAYVNHRAKSRGWARVKRATIHVTIWLIAISSAVLMTSYFALEGLISLGSFELRGDLLFPVLALFLEEFVRMASKLIHWFEARVAKLLGLVFHVRAE